MPSTRTITVYEFGELSDEAKNVALNTFRYFNVNCNWYETVYEDAEKIGLKITEFDIAVYYMNMDKNTIKGHLKQDFLDVCRLIRKNHGKYTETRQTAKKYLEEYIAEFNRYRGNDKQNLPELLKDFQWEDEAKDIEIDFVRALLEDYLIMLREEYEYLTSDEAVKESIELNEMKFLKNGNVA